MLERGGSVGATPSARLAWGATPELPLRLAGPSGLGRDKWLLGGEKRAQVPRGGGFLPRCASV